MRKQDTSKKSLGFWQFVSSKTTAFGGRVGFDGGALINLWLDRLVDGRSACIAAEFKTASAAIWFPLARRILAHAKVTGVTDAQLIAVIVPCNSNSQQFTHVAVSLALRVCKANALAQNLIARAASVV
jgi:hypothetical protein